MTLFNPTNLRPAQDNVLVQLDMHANAQAEERRLASGLYVPKTADNGASAGTGECVAARIAATGPGHWTDSFRDSQKGTVPHGDGFWLPMDEALQPGARVMVDSPLAGDRVYSEDSMAEFRMVREENVVMLLPDDGDPIPMGDRVLVAPDRSDQRTASGLFLANEAVPMPTEGEVLAVGPGKRLADGTRRTLGYREGDRVLFGKFAGNKVRVEGHELLLLREEDVLAVVAQSVAGERAA